MLAQDLIVDDIPPLKLTDTGETALRWMDDFRVAHLSVVDNNRYLGTISDSDILGMTDIDEPLQAYRELFNPVFITQYQHIFEVVKVINDHHLSIVPVLDKDESYKGSITVYQLMKIIADMPVANSPGGIIVLELNQHDYSLQNIAGIIEENEAKILGTFITSHSDSTKIQLTIKVNRVDINAIINSLERHEYHITYFHDNGNGQLDLRDRFDALMNYLNA